ncbi:hypothetical protein [Pseudacidovorax intermedius]|uniref:hypothetical protein n=1 Tax=Pseudacidovorax intermedius TaxID=433924 RepID=UPI0011C03899|nr:hypothetical protein [Pseudacidovorax intermedius]
MHVVDLSIAQCARAHLRNDFAQSLLGIGFPSDRPTGTVRLVNFQTYCLQHRPEAREITDAIQFMELDIFCRLVPRADEPYIQKLGKFISDTLAGKARVALDEALAAAADCAQLELDELGKPL